MLARTFLTASAALCCVGAFAQSTSSASRPLPTVDLDYVIQQASSYDATGEFYSFNNIRFAKAPVGDLRFAAPQPPDVNRTVVQNGTEGKDCPNVFPAWLGQAGSYIPQYLNGSTNFTVNPVNASAIPTIGDAYSEDCLFLDVVVPEEIFATRNNSGYGAPVLVWIYGGGYTGGSKSLYGSPAGLLNRSQTDGSQGVVYVAMNYRLGAFGWTAGPTFQEDGGLANAALYDQRLALKWIQDNIAKFGGDPNRVTVFGESAGGGSIMHQITAFGGANETLFQQAILQSPAWQPLVSMQQQEVIYHQFLSLLGVSNLEEAKKLNTTQLQLANAIQIQNSGYGQFTFGPAVDGVISPQLPGQLLAKGLFHKDIRVMVGHNSDEGLLFTPPIYNNSDVVFQLETQVALPSLNAWPAVVSYLVDTLYPSENFSNEIERSSLFIAESFFSCNTFYLDKAFGNETYAYLFSIPPGEHGNDIAYTFYTDGSVVKSTEIALALQNYITHFAMYGYPNKPGVPYFPMYQNNATIQDLNITGISQIRDPVANQRCNWWQKALYY